jgi:hypothetical protein
MHRILFAHRAAIGAVLTVLVAFFGATRARTQAVFTNPVVEALADASAGVLGTDGHLERGTDTEIEQGDTTAVQAEASYQGDASSSAYRVVDGVISAEIATDSAAGGGTASASGVGAFTETFLVTSSTLPAGTPVDLLVELEFSSTLSPNNVADPCLGVAPTVVTASATLITPAGFVFTWDHTCDGLDSIPPSFTQVLQRQVGDEFQTVLLAEIGGGGVGGTTTGSVMARMYVTPLGEADYVTASGNDYRRPDVADPTVEEQIEALVQTVASLNLQAGISNSLDAKLDAARNALDDVNAHNDGAAINSLYALINHIEAQRGQKLTDEQADELTAAALAIIEAIQSGAS